MGKKRSTDRGVPSNGTPLSRGPKPEHVHIEGDWEEAVKKALKKPPPPKPGQIGKEEPHDPRDKA